MPRHRWAAGPGIALVLLLLATIRRAVKAIRGKGTSDGTTEAQGPSLIDGAGPEFAECWDSEG